MTIALLAQTSVSAQNRINLAGIYELNTKVDGGTHQMYLELDFVNQRPDFTQTFTEKTSAFKLLPEDFMNAKKLKQKFKGTKTPGFGKYREKYLLSITEELRITNPHVKKGVIIADWENDMAKTGKVIILPNEDGSIVTYGLTSLDRSLSPDGMRLELTKELATDSKEKKYTETAAANAGFIEEIRTSCTTDFPGTIQRLLGMPDDSTPKAATTENNAKQPAKENGHEINIKLWGDNQPVVFKCHVISTGGDYGKFETNATMDFWPEENGEIAMRIYSNSVYVNSGNIREYEYIYTGRREGNKIVFTRKQDSLNGGETAPLESWEASVLTIKSPTEVIFDRCTYKNK